MKRVSIVFLIVTILLFSSSHITANTIEDNYEIDDVLVYEAYSQFIPGEGNLQNNSFTIFEVFKGVSNDKYKISRYFFVDGNLDFGVNEYFDIHTGFMYNTEESRYGSAVTGEKIMGWWFHPTIAEYKIGTEVEPRLGTHITGESTVQITDKEYDVWIAQQEFRNETHDLIGTYYYDKVVGREVYSESEGNLSYTYNFNGKQEQTPFYFRGNRTLVEITSLSALDIELPEIDEDDWLDNGDQDTVDEDFVSLGEIVPVGNLPILVLLTLSLGSNLRRKTKK